MNIGNIINKDIGKTLLCALLIGLCGAGSAIAQNAADKNELEGLRNLKFKTRVPYKYVTLKEASEYMKKQAEKEYDPDRAYVRQAFFSSLNLLPAGTDLQQCVNDLYAEQVRGIYDSDSKSYLVVKDAPKAEIEGQMGRMLKRFNINLEHLYEIHELDHALTDQHFSLDKTMEQADGKFDKELAVLSVMEGDAMTVLFMSMGKGLHIGSDFIVDYIKSDPSLLDNAISRYPQMSKTPALVREYVISPYYDGTMFVDFLRKRGGWNEVNKAYEKVPASTEHILHPVKYCANSDLPKEVSLASMPRKFKKYKLVGEDTAGELLVRILAKQRLDRNEAIKAAAGWGGDTWRVYRDGEKFFTVWATVWDSEADACEFENLLKTVIKDNGTAERRKECVLVTLGVPENMLRNVKKSAWKMKVR